jgi:hypothetical protein
MAKTSDRPTQTIEALRPYVKRAMEDPELREDLIAAFVTARGLYDKIAKERGVKGKAAKVSKKDFQEDIQGLIEELSDASDRLQGESKRKSHKLRNRVILLTGVTIGVLYNPWTGAATREWISEQLAGGGPNGFEEFGAESLATESETSGIGTEPAEA